MGISIIACHQFVRLKSSTMITDWGSTCVHWQGGFVNTMRAVITVVIFYIYPPIYGGYIKNSSLKLLKYSLKKKYIIGNIF